MYSDSCVKEDLLRAADVPESASHLHVLIKRLERLLDNDQAEKLNAAAGISIPEWRVLFILATFGSLSQRDLIRRILMEQSQASRVTKAMASKGFISLERDEADLRRWICSLTELGRERFELASPVMKVRKTHIDSALSGEEHRQFLSFARRIAERTRSDAAS